MSIIACGMLFLTMPLLGAIVAHFTAEKAIRSQFLTAIFAPTVVIGVFLIRTNQTKAAIHEQAQEHVSNENKNIKSEYRILAEKKQPELLNTGEIPQ